MMTTDAKTAKLFDAAVVAKAALNFGKFCCAVYIYAATP